MLIWAWRMTETRAKTWAKTHVGIASVLRRYCIGALVALPGAAAADAWDMFVARCLDPFEHQSLAVVDGLSPQPVDQMLDASHVFGPTDEGYILVLNAAPRDGERACAVEYAGHEVSQGAADWLAEQADTGRYVPAPTPWMMSNEWIEPRVMMRVEVTAVRTAYEIVETDLES